jgi:hypothetical protein
MSCRRLLWISSAAPATRMCLGGTRMDVRRLPLWVTVSAARQWPTIERHRSLEEKVAQELQEAATILAM